MGSQSSKRQISEEEKKQRENLGQLVNQMQHRLAVTAKAHFKSSEHYRNRDRTLQMFAYVTGILGPIGAVYVPLTWKKMGAKYPLLASVSGAFSVASLLFTGVVKTNHHSTAALHRLHFEAGNECRYLERRVQFFAESSLSNPNVPWGTLATTYLNLLQEQKVVNSKIQTEEWAYRAALDKIEKREKEKREKERERQAQMKQ